MPQHFKVNQVLKLFIVVWMYLEIEWRLTRAKRLLATIKFTQGFILFHKNDVKDLILILE